MFHPTIVGEYKVNTHFRVRNTPMDLVRTGYSLAATTEKDKVMVLPLLHDRVSYSYKGTVYSVDTVVLRFNYDYTEEQLHKEKEMTEYLRNMKNIFYV